MMSWKSLKLNKKKILTVQNNPSATLTADNYNIQECEESAKIIAESNGHKDICDFRVFCVGFYVDFCWKRAV